MPEISRPTPAYVQIHDHYKALILDGALYPRQVLPPIRQIADDFSVSPETAQKAVTMLKDSGLTVTTHQGTFVADDLRIERTAGERLTRTVEGVHGEHVEVTAAGIVPAPIYVAEILGIDPGTLLIRREEITRREDRPRMLAVDWIPDHHAKDLCAHLLQRAPVEGGTIGAVERATSRPVAFDREALRGRGADKREADALGLAIGTPILAGVHRFLDADGGCLLYGEWVLPPDTVVCYSYAPA